MRISVFPKGDLDALAIHHTMTIFEWIDKARPLNAEGLELYGGMFLRTDDAFVDDVGAALADAGFEMPMMCLSPDLVHPDPDTRRREFDRQVEMMHVARRLGGPGVSARVLSGQRHPEVGVEEGVDRVVGAIHELLPLARELEMSLAIENHYKAPEWAYPEFAQRPEVFLAILDGVQDRASFGVQYDPSNAVVAGVDSADFLDQVVDRVITMQASDRFLAPGASLESLRQSDGTLGYSPLLQHGVIGRGLNDYPRIFTALVDAGYDGWISIEDGVNGMEEMAESVEYLREARDRHFGGSTAVAVRAQDEARAASGLPSFARTPQLG
ncbi:sugar phosphate isomerase/epimerase family protein [Microbacterium sp. NPDC058342]|uniref:sugar phosphate isomerase/epimerase family protein n=1 Tax=Microbacterium sp. NPDC058342 TaxID=3346454 RepID=UPI00364CFE69